MVPRVMTVAFRGIEAVPVDVQVMIAPGRVGMSIVGLANKAIAESRERIQAALHAVGLSMPVKKVTVNLAPADLPKEGSHYDLPIAIGLMMGMGILPMDLGEHFIVLGELALDGSIAPVNGVLPAAMRACALEKGLICPEACGPEAAFVSNNLNILAPQSLISLVNHFKGRQILARPAPLPLSEGPSVPDLADVRGQVFAKRALEVAAAGGHNLLFIGPPGSGKSMLAQRLPGLLPRLDVEELLEVSLIYSLAGLTTRDGLSWQRPFRSPHHSASQAAMVGGGQKAKPGEVSLAHKGVLFLDELPEFAPQVLESLRQPLESHSCTVARANYHITYPADIQLIAAMNPCRCGLYGEPGHVCARGARCRLEYQARLSGPLLDRIDLRVEVPAVSASDLMIRGKAEPSHMVAARVHKARQRQKERFAALGAFSPSVLGDRATEWTNASCPAGLIEQVVQLSGSAQKMLKDVSAKMRFSARSYHRILKVALSISDLSGADKVEDAHLAEALSYRCDTYFSGSST